MYVRRPLNMSVHLFEQTLACIHDRREHCECYLLFADCCIHVAFIADLQVDSSQYNAFSPKRLFHTVYLLLIVNSVRFLTDYFVAL
jgi:hypothetical protein